MGMTNYQSVSISGDLISDLRGSGGVCWRRCGEMLKGLGFPS